MANQSFSISNIIPSKAPNLPVAPLQYDADFQNKFENILRLYFNQIDNAIGQLVATGTVTNPNYVISNTESPYALPPYLQVSRGLVSGTSVLNIYGYQSALPNSSGATYYPVWENATAYTYPPSAIPMVLYSSSASDTAVSISISGLDASYNPASETLVCTGTSGVTTVGTYLRINSLTTTGTNNAVGDISLSNVGKSITYAKILAGNGKSQAMVYTVPNGYTFYLTRSNAYSNLNGNTALNYVNYRVWTQSSAGLIQILLQAPFQSNYQTLRVAPRPYTAKTDIQWQISGNPSSGNSSVGVGVEGILIANGTV
jgi:hypothetical protein